MDQIFFSDGGSPLSAFATLAILTILTILTALTILTTLTRFIQFSLLGNNSLFSIPVECLDGDRIQFVRVSIHTKLACVGHDFDRLQVMTAFHVRRRQQLMVKRI